MTFIGTIHSDRAKLAKKIFEQFRPEDMSTYEFYYCPSKILFILKKLFTSEFDFISLNEVSFSSMSKSDVRDVLLSSSAVLDIQHPHQIGLTMRTIEMLGLNKKLITTNSDIVNYDFFNDKNVLVVDRDKPVIRSGFLTSPFESIDKEIYKKYSLRNWLVTIFTDENKQ